MNRPITVAVVFQELRCSMCYKLMAFLCIYFQIHCYAAMVIQESTMLNMLSALNNDPL
jgi:hypothetical protein